jgi:hypothetical protein
MVDTGWVRLKVSSARCLPLCEWVLSLRIWNLFTPE